MARSRRRKKSLGEELFGLAIIIAFAASFSTSFRKVIFPILIIALVLGLIAGVVFVLYKMVGSKTVKYKLERIEPIPPNKTNKRPLTKLEKEWESSSTCAASADWAMGSVKMTAPVVWTLDLLISLEWKRFETVCNEYLKEIGYNAKETRIGADGGVDIVVRKSGMEKPLAIVQCKAWSKQKVGVKPVRELFGLMAAEQVINGMFITTGDYTSEALEFARGKKLKLITGRKLLEVIRKLPPERRVRLLSLATEGDFTTPTCPRCGIKMTVRQSSKGRGAGGKFWGCVRYPKCRSTLVFK
jgi:restriction system protein